MDGGNVLKNVDAVSSALKDIEASLKNVDTLMGSLGSKSGDVAGNLSSASGGPFSGSSVGGGGKTNGAASPSFTSPAKFGGVPGIGGNAGGGIGAGGGMPPGGAAGAPAAAAGAPGGVPPNVGMPQAAASPTGPPTTAWQQFGMRHPRAYSGIAVGLGMGAAAWGTLPGVGEVRGQRQSMFTATLAYGAGARDFDALKDTISEGAGGYATSTDSQERVARQLGLYGMDIAPGSQSLKDAMSEVSAMSMLTGRPQEEMEAARRSLATGDRANRLYMLGISTTNADGSPKDFGATVKSVMDMSMRGEYDIDDVQQGLAAGGMLRDNFARALGAENADLAAQYAMVIASTGNQTGVLSPEEMERLGFNDPKLNPAAAEQRAIGERSETISDYSDAVLAGWGKALEAAQSVERVMQQLEGVLSPLASGKAFGEGLMSQPSTGSLLTGLGVAATGIGQAAILSRMGGAAAGGGGLLSKLLGGGAAAGSTVGGAAGSTAGGSVLGSIAAHMAKAGPAGFLKGGVIGGLVAGATDLAVGAFGTDEESTKTEKVIGSLARVLGNVGTGALTGLAIGGPWGALIGGVAGAGMSAYDMLKKDGYGWDYGDKANTISGQLFGAEGDGGGNSASGETGAQKDASGPASTQGGNTVAAAIQRSRGFAASGRANWKNLCQRHVANAYGLPRGHYNSASIAWRSIPKDFKYPGDRSFPAGALVYWTGGSSGHGHVALSLGNGTMTTNDSSGRIVIWSNSKMFQYYGKLQFVGWAQPYFGRLLATVSGGVPTSVTVDGGGQTTGARSQNTTGGANGMTAVGVEPWGGSQVSASPYGGVAAGQYSIAGGVASSIEGLMTGGGNLSGGSQTEENKTNTTGSEVGYNEGERGPNANNGQFVVTSAPGPGKGVQRWENVARNAMAAAGLPDKYFNLLMHRMNVESSGRPDVVNNWDSNAKRGTPSMGLMQVIGPTFDAYAGPYKNRGQTDPFANIYAAIRYTLDRYGMDGVEGAWSGRAGYSEGAWRVSKDQIADVHQGEMILPAREAEVVRTAARKARAGQYGDSSGGGSAKRVDVHVHMTGNTEFDSREFARRVKAAWESDNETIAIGGA